MSPATSKKKGKEFKFPASWETYAEPAIRRPTRSRSRETYHKVRTRYEPKLPDYAQDALQKKTPKSLTPGLVDPMMISKQQYWPELEKNATWCPPTMGATIFSGTSMAAMYLSGLVFFSQALNPIALLGAAFMLVAVCATTMSRPRAPSDQKQAKSKMDSQGDIEQGTAASWEGESGVSTASGSSTPTSAASEQ